MVAVISISPKTRPFPAAGNQRVITRAAPGNIPASAAPKSARTASSDTNPVAAPVTAVMSDQLATIRASTTRGPNRSASQPPGTSNRA
jgi:hypothetical protein